MDISYYVRPHLAETVSGDAVAVYNCDSFALISVIDGLGHGPEANVAAETAKRTILGNPDLDPGELMEKCHSALRSTRGAAVAIMKLQDYRGLFSGVGNIGIIAKSLESIHAISIAGIVGNRLRKIKEFEFKYQPNDLFCLFSDGLATRSLSLDNVDRKDLDSTAKRLVEDHGKDHDDASLCLVVTS